MMPFDLQSIAQAALDMASLSDADQETQNSEAKSSDLGDGSVQTGLYKSPTVSDEGEDGNDHLPSQHIIPGPENSASEHNEAGTPPTQAEIWEAPTSQAHEVEDSEKPGSVAVVDFAATAETPVSQPLDNTVNALFDDYDDYESQLDESPNQSGTSQAESSDELFVRQPSPSHEVNTDTNTNGGNSDDEAVHPPSTRAVSIASVENKAVETQPELHEHPENTTSENVETTAGHGEDLQSGLVASQASTIPYEEAQLDPQVESGDNEHDQASQEEIKESIDQSNSDARQSSSQAPGGGSKVPIAHMEVSFEENQDQDVNQEIEPLTPPDQDQSQTEELAHREPIEESRPESMMESTEIVSRNHSQASEGYTDEEAESQHSPLEVASEPVAKQEEDEEKPAIPELQSPRLKVDSLPREVKTEETHNSPEPSTQSGVDEKESPVPEDRAQPADASPAPKEAAPEQREEEYLKPRARKPLPVGPLLNRPQKAKPAPKAPRKRKLGIYDYFYESDPENWPKKSRIARPQPHDKPKAKKAAATKTKKRSREEQEDEDHEATAAASDASDDEALAVKKREPKKPRAAPKAAKERKAATEKKKRGPKPGAKKPGPKKKKTEELSKPIVESDFDNDSEFVVEANNEDHSEEE